MVCDICGKKKKTKTYENSNGSEYEMCDDCVESAEYENYKSEVNNTYKEMTR